MDIKNQIDEFMQTDMDRKEFLAKVGVAGLAVFGVSNVIKGLVDSPRPRRGGGYGGSAYGGDRKLGQISRKLN